METKKLNRKLVYLMSSFFIAMAPGFAKAATAANAGAEAILKSRRSSFSSNNTGLEASAGCNCSTDTAGFSTTTTSKAITPLSDRRTSAAPSSSGLSTLIFTGLAVTNYMKTKAADAAAATRSTATAIGRTIMPNCEHPVLEESGKASYYGPGVGPRTATGARFNRQGMTAAHPDRDMLGKKVVLRDATTGKTVAAEINDLCPGCKPRTNGKIIDLSEGLFRRFASTSQGIIKKFEIWVCKDKKPVS